MPNSSAERSPRAVGTAHQMAFGQWMDGDHQRKSALFQNASRNWTEAQQQEVGEFLQALRKKNDDVHQGHVWAAVK